MPPAVPIPRNLRRHFAPEVLRDAKRILAKGRVDSPVFFRSGVAGRVVMPNGAVVLAFLVVDRAGSLVHVSCSCLSRQRPATLCHHLAALVVSAVQGAPPEEPALPGERFEESVWVKLAAGLHAFGGRDVPLHEADAKGEPEAVTSRLVARDRTVLAELAVEKGRDPWPLLGAVMREGARPGPIETRLVQLATTPEEAALNLAGARTQRQAFESSLWHVLARRAFETFGEAPPAVVEADGRGLWFTVRDGSRGTFRLSLSPDAVDGLHRADPSFLARHGFPVSAGIARSVLRLAFAPDGGLRLIPHHQVHLAPDRDLFVPRDGGDAIRLGSLLFLAPERRLVPVDATRKPFAEPEASLQGELLFDATYRPSPVGIPLERETVVPAEEVARFLTRHRAEIAALPEALLPPELRAGGLVEPEAAELVAFGEEPGRRFVLGVTYLFAGTRVPFESILRARRRRETLLAYRGALLDPRSHRFGWMDLLDPGAVRGTGSKARLVVEPLALCRLRSYLPADQRVSAAPGVATGELSRLDAHAPDTAAPPAGDLGLTLYDFQKTGYAWLWFLYRSGLGGLLCDDMGLGKTHQVMALLSAVRAVEGRVPSVLVVCPASVLPHWEDKLRSYVPGVPVLTHHGAGRRTAAAREGVLLTTYGTLRNDAAALEGETFDLFVLDEIQTIKNRATATHQALLPVKARVALGLTGTPVENGVEELRNLLDFVLPGYLPGDAAFTKAFVRPIEQGDTAARERLRRLVSPFVLRRSKEQVLTFLPEKIEDRRHCSLTDEQQALYRDLLEGKGAGLASALDGPGPVPYLHVFALLTKLKQLCDHPDLLLPPHAPSTGRSSGKWELFAELLDEALGSGLKVVVFSQYLRMLDMMARHLEGRGTGFEEIRGSTADRARPVARFRDDPGCRVFLASLKAAGLGIDLTPASVVVHYDRWWTSARERQATDRVHRIGQTRGVQVLTLVTRGTVEERIDRLIARKAELAADVVPEDEPGFLKRFTRAELRELLAP